MDIKYNELKRNTLIIGVANLGSKAISFILAPLYSYWMTVEQYGQMDIITTTVLLLTPIVCLDIYDATFRYANEDRKKVASISIAFSIPSIIIALIAIMILVFIYHNTVVSLCCIYLVLNLLESVLQQFVRGQNRLELFALSGVLDSVSLLILNIVFLVSLRLQLLGWLISVLLAKSIACIFLLYKSQIAKDVSITNIEKSMALEMLRFCIPLLPNAVMWWIMNLSDRFMLTAFIGNAATGLYAVSNKIPSIMSIFENIFYQSWQTSAITNLNNDNRDVFYSDVFNKYFTILSIGIIGGLAIAKELTILLFASDFSSAWIAIAPLSIGVLIHALSTNIGALYVAFKKTNGAFYTSLIGALTNIVLNIIFIPKYGIIAAAVTTLIGYIVTFVVRWFDIRRLVVIKINKLNVIAYLSLIVIQTLLFYIKSSQMVIRVLIFGIVVLKERKLLMNILRR